MGKNPTHRILPLTFLLVGLGEGFDPPGNQPVSSPTPSRSKSWAAPNRSNI
jgi:hypothetical protein